MSLEKQFGRSWIIIPGLIILALGIVFGLYFGLAYILRKADNAGTGSTATTKTSGKLADQNLAGTWESDCLVPDPNSKWAEKHKLIINKDGAATHTRQDWAMNDCASLQPTGTITDQFKLSIPAAGKINLSIVSMENPRMEKSQANQLAGNTIYDIYKISGNTLEFGHGFRGDDLAYSGKNGGSETDRFDSLNKFIIYNKK